MNAPAIDERCDAVRRLARVAEILRVENSDDAIMHAAALESIVRGDEDAETALGLKAKLGRRGAVAHARITERNRALAAAADALAPRAEIAEQARVVRSALDRFAGPAWGRYSDAASCPARLANRPERFLWEAMKAHPSVPSERQIRRILSD